MTVKTWKRGEFVHHTAVTNAAAMAWGFEAEQWVRTALEKVRKAQGGGERVSALQANHAMARAFEIFA